MKYPWMLFEENEKLNFSEFLFLLNEKQLSFSKFQWRIIILEYSYYLTDSKLFQKKGKY
jgi:hypothetical protein